MTSKPPSALHTRAMAVLDNTGIIMGTAMGIAMEDVMAGLAEKLGQAMSAIGGAVAGALGGKPVPAPAPDLAALPPAVRRDLLKAVTTTRTEFKVDTSRRDAAAARLTDAYARTVLSAAESHLVGLPALDANLSDEQLAGIIAVVLGNDARWGAYMQAIGPVMTEITAEAGG